MKLLHREFGNIVGYFYHLLFLTCARRRNQLAKSLFDLKSKLINPLFSHQVLWNSRRLKAMIVRLDEIALVVLQKFIWTFIFSLLKLILQRAQL